MLDKGKKVPGNKKTCGVNHKWKNIIKQIKHLPSNGLLAAETEGFADVFPLSVSEMGLERLVALACRVLMALRPSVPCPPYILLLVFDCANAAATFCLAASCNSSLRVRRGFTEQK